MLSHVRVTGGSGSGNKLGENLAWVGVYLLYLGTLGKVG
jgi:hypothetical protein